MTEGEYQNKKDSIMPIAPTAPELPQVEKKTPLTPDLEIYLAVLEAMQRPKRHLTTAPSFVPRNFPEQIQFYDDEGGTPVRRVYFYFNDDWSYVTLI
jgi:hypothetical protein